ncbi:MAG: TlpA family protein disulfide reductase [Gemmataceae bacterium]|nr:TlpA family protein disulfide reductase [Gemmataceae bacterium]
MRCSLLVAVALVGCMNQASPPPGPKDFKGKSPVYIPAEEVAINICKWADLEKAVVSHQGKVVVIDVWATYCVPCVKKLPDMLAMQKKYADKGVVLITVSLDDKSDADKARNVLKKMDASVQNFLLDETAEVADAKLGGTALPVVRIVGRDGGLKKLFTPEDAFEVSDVEKVVKELTQ